MHAEGQLLLWVLVELLPHCKSFGYHLALLNPFGFIITAAKDPGRETKAADVIRIPDGSGRFSFFFSAVSFLVQIWLS